MKILGLESSCDETAASIVEDGREVLSSVVASQIDIHKQYGGVIPEVAARSHIEAIIPVINESLEQAGLKMGDIDALAVTEGPGLIGSLIVGVETAKALAWSLKKPLIPVNHLIGHIYANWLEEEPVKFPALCLVVSGGHTLLLYMKSHTELFKIGQTSDDAAGEAFDKVAKLLDLGYPGGPAISAAALKGDETRFKLPRAMMTADQKRAGNFNYSFSGLKTAVLRVTKEETLDEKGKNDLAASFQAAVVDSLITKVEWYLDRNPEIQTVMLAGGVSANQKLKDELKRRMLKRGFNGEVRWPEPKNSTDNAAMIAAAAYYHQKITDPFGVSPFPSGIDKLIQIV